MSRFDPKYMTPNTPNTFSHKIDKSLIRKNNHG